MEKLFASNLHIRTGEFEFDYPLAFYSKNYEEANKKAQEYAKTFYGDGEENSIIGEGYYEFNCGCIITNIDFVQEVSDQGQWLSQFWNRFKI